MKVKVGKIRQRAIVEGDANLLQKNELLITQEEGYTILRERIDTGELKTYVVVSLDDMNFNKE